MTTRPLETVLRQLRRLIDVQPESALPDERLLQSFARHGDQAAFEAIVRRHGPTVLGVCRRRLTEPADVEDAFQATFLVLVRKAGSVRRGASLGSWLYGVANKVATRALFRRLREKDCRREITDIPAPEGPCEVMRRDLQAVLDEEVQRLPEKYRAPVLLCYFQHKTSEEAARLLGWPTGTLHTRLSRAREELRKRLIRRGVALSAALGLLGETAVPESLLAATVEGMAAVAGALVRTAVSAGALELMNGVLRDMFLNKLTTIGFLTFAFAATGIGITLAAHHTPAGPTRTDRAEAAPPKPTPPKGKDNPQDDPKAPDAKGRVSWTAAGSFRVLKVDGGVDALVFSPDGKTIVSAGPFDPGSFIGGPGDDASVKVWDVKTGKQTVKLQRGFNGVIINVQAVAFSPDGKTLAMDATGDNTVTLWDLTANKSQPLSQGAKNRAAAGSLAFSPDGKTLAVGLTDGTVNVWDVSAKTRVAVLKNLTGQVTALAFTGDGKTLAAADYGGALQVWTLEKP